jgi:hypothetical protein|tara:strand:+ start:2362 stop:2667 length:306 start_codon:yes stop_codon:yes gene_type:complete
MTTKHFNERINRLKELGLKRTEIVNIIKKGMLFLYNNPHMENTAILVKELKERFYCEDGSVGEDIWLITRDGRLTTTMLRPRNRPKTTEYFKGIDSIVIAC